MAFRPPAGGVRWKSHSLPRSVGCNMMSILPKRDVFPSLPFTESAETAVARRKLINKTFLICSLPSRIPIPISPFPSSRTPRASPPSPEGVQVNRKNIRDARGM